MAMKIEGAWRVTIGLAQTPSAGGGQVGVFPSWAPTAKVGVARHTEWRLTRMSDDARANSPSGGDDGVEDISGELFGYVQPLCAAPGDQLEVKVSTTEEAFDFELVRLVHGDTDPAGPGLLTELVSGGPKGQCPGRLQHTQCGSYGEVRLTANHPPPLGFMLDLKIWPTTPTRGGRQILVEIDARGDRVATLELKPGGSVSWTFLCADGTSTVLSTDVPLTERRWYAVAATVGGQEGTATLAIADLADPTANHSVSCHSGAIARGAWTLVRFAAGTRSDGNGTATDGFYNGKLERPRIADAHSGEILYDWDLSDSAGWAFTDLGPEGRKGVLVNAPTRATTGYNWSGDALSHVHVPEQYGAVHFHDDDLDDARWETDTTIHLPAGIRSGIYAVRLSAGDLADFVPLFIRPAPNARRPAIVFVVPTFTYQAYANDRLTSDFDFEAAGITNRPIVADWRERQLTCHPEWGLSLYARHSDDSGVCYSTLRRPVLTMRPDYRSALAGSARLLGADLYITMALERLGFDYDVITDHDLHHGGTDLLKPYAVVVTGAHPEYASRQTLDAIELHTADGGGLVYLGGNGFYWVTSCDPATGEVIEVRRGHVGGIWESAPGETYHSTTGEPGGLWRHRGRAPNRLVGVGFISQGWDDHAAAYRVTPDGRRDEVSFIFDGVDLEKPIGDFGLVMGGAAGYEIDCANRSLGTPTDAIIVASSAGQHSDYYQVAIEEVRIMSNNLGGTADSRVRADMCYLRTPGSGSVFSVGSLGFSGSLSHNDFHNSCSRILTNVLHEFIARHN